MFNTDEQNVLLGLIEYGLQHIHPTGDLAATLESARQKIVRERDGDHITSGWSVEDVESLMEGRDDCANLSADDKLSICRKVLAAADHGHDATVGINWDVLEVYLDDELRERTKAKS